MRFAGNLGAPLQMADDNALHDKGSKTRLDPENAVTTNGIVRGLVSSNPLAAGIFEDDDSLLEVSAMYVSDHVGITAQRAGAEISHRTPDLEEIPIDERSSKKSPEGKQEA